MGRNEVELLEDQLASAKERLNNMLRQKNKNPWEASEWKKEIETLENKIRIAKGEASMEDVRDSPFYSNGSDTIF